MTGIDAAVIAREAFGIDAEPEPLPGERDLNFRLDGWVLKIHHPDTDPAVLDLQDAALAHLGMTTRRTTHGGRVVRLVPWVEGGTAGAPLDRRWMGAVGGLVARIDQCLADFTHPAMKRVTPWDLRQAGLDIDFDGLPHQVIHNDANELNIVLGDDGVPAALIDFGDVVWTARVCGPAIAAAYAMQGHADPLTAILPLIAAYDAIAPFTVRELEVLYPLIRARLELSVRMAAQGRERDPDNDYLLISQTGVRGVLDALAGVDPDLAHFRLRDACGYEAVPWARTVRQRLALAEAAPVMDGAPHAGSAVHAALDGTVAIAMEDCVVLDHDGFYTRYQPLADGLPEVGTSLRAGARIGALSGDQLHLQILTTLVGTGEASLRESVSLDPKLLLGRPEGVRERAPVDAGDIARRRRGVLSRALSISYSQPLHIVRGEGAHLYDADGNAWLDLVNNVAHVGHCHPRVVAAGQRQMAQLNTNTRYLHDSVVTYARRLAATLPDPLRVVFCVNSGSEANDLALRLARAHTAARDVLVLEHAYHGHLSSLIDISPYKAPPPPGTEVLPIGGRVEGDTPLAAFFAEAIPGCAGQVVLPGGFLADAYAAARSRGAVCVADEVQSGLGRVGSHFWAFEREGVVPDIVTIGKPAGNGHPLAAVVTTPAIARSFETGMEYFNTFGGNPVSTEIGLAVLDVIADERLQAHAASLGDHLLSELRRLDSGLITDVRGAGLFLGVELATHAGAVKEAIKARGILISTDGPDDRVLKIKPPLVIARADADRFVEALAAALG